MRRSPSNPLKTDFQFCIWMVRALEKGCQFNWSWVGEAAIFGVGENQSILEQFKEFIYFMIRLITWCSCSWPLLFISQKLEFLINNANSLSTENLQTSNIPLSPSAEVFSVSYELESQIVNHFSNITSPVDAFKANLALDSCRRQFDRMQRSTARFLEPTLLLCVFVAALFRPRIFFRHRQQVEATDCTHYVLLNVQR